MDEYINLLFVGALAALGVPIVMIAGGLIGLWKPVAFKVRGKIYPYNPFRGETNVDLTHSWSLTKSRHVRFAHRRLVTNTIGVPRRPIASYVTFQLKEIAEAQQAFARGRRGAGLFGSK